MDSSKPTEGELNQSTSIPRSREAKEEALEGEIIDRGVPLTRPTVDADPKPPPPRRGRMRTAVVVFLSVSALICVGGAIAGFLWYHSASEPDRSTPNLVVAEYLSARFDQKDSVEAGHFICGSPDLSGINALAQDIDSRSRLFSVPIAITWENFNVTFNDKTATVTVDIRLTVTVDQVMQREIQHWRFEMVQEDGWRLCAGRQDKG